MKAELLILVVEVVLIAALVRLAWNFAEYHTDRVTCATSGGVWKDGRCSTTK